MAYLGGGDLWVLGPLKAKQINTKSDKCSCGIFKT